jgi:putative ABC transport system permease protein
VEDTYRRLFPGQAYEFFFLDDDFDRQYRAEEQLNRIFTLFTGLGILIACLGLFGVVAFLAEQRTKEIGVRKVLGATVTNIVTLLIKEFIFLVVLAGVIATPIAWVAMQRWLQNFAYRIDLEWWIFLGASLIALTIALGTISFQAIKAAVADPVKSLRYE